MFFVEMGRLLRSATALLKNELTFWGAIIGLIVLFVCLIALCWLTENPLGRFVLIAIGWIVVIIPIFNNAEIVTKEQELDFWIAAGILGLILGILIDFLFYKIKKEIKESKTNT